MTALLVAVAAYPLMAGADETVEPSGPITRLQITSAVNCDIMHEGDRDASWFAATACGTFVQTGTQLYGPGEVPGSGYVDGSAGYAGFTAETQNQSGTGTAADPYTITTSVSLGTSGLSLNEVDTYVSGDENYATTVRLTNSTTTAVPVTLYRAGDCFLQDNQRGRGGVTGSSPYCKALPGSADPTRKLGMFPSTGGSHYFEGNADDMWAALRTGAALPDTCTCNTTTDNAVALSFALTLPAGGGGTVGGMTGSDPPATTSPANSAPVATGQSVTTPRDRAKSVTLQATDADNDSLTYGVVRQPRHGTITAGTGATRRYTPDSGFTGSDSFTFRANDGTADSNVATVQITVTPRSGSTGTTTPTAPVPTDPTMAPTDPTTAPSDPTTRTVTAGPTDTDSNTADPTSAGAGTSAGSTTAAARTSSGSALVVQGNGNGIGADPASGIVIGSAPLADTGVQVRDEIFAALVVLDVGLIVLLTGFVRPRRRQQRAH